VVRSRHTKHFFCRGLFEVCSRGAKVFHARKNKMNPEEKGDAFAELILWFRKNIGFFLVGAKKITSKQCLFNKNIVLVFLFDGAARERALPLRKDIDRGVFFFRPEENRLNAPETVFSHRPFHPMKKSARGGPDRVDEKNNFFGGSARMGASPAFMEYRSVKKDRGSNRRLFWSGTEEKTRGGRCPF
jgi:hypothetical protein